MGVFVLGLVTNIAYDAAIGRASWGDLSRNLASQCGANFVSLVEFGGRECAIKCCHGATIGVAGQLDTASLARETPGVVRFASDYQTLPISNDWIAKNDFGPVIVATIGRRSTTAALLLFRERGAAEFPQEASPLFEALCEHLERALAMDAIRLAAIRAGISPAALSYRARIESQRHLSRADRLTCFDDFEDAFPVSRSRQIDKDMPVAAPLDRAASISHARGVGQFTRFQPEAESIGGVAELLERQPGPIGHEFLADDFDIADQRHTKADSDGCTVSRGGERDRDGRGQAEGGGKKEVTHG